MRFIAAEYTEGAENLFYGICEAPWLACQARRYGRRPVPDDSPRNQLDAFWRETQSRLRASVPESTYRLWLEPLEAAVLHFLARRSAAPALLPEPRQAG